MCTLISNVKVILAEFELIYPDFFKKMALLNEPNHQYCNVYDVLYYRRNIVEHTHYIIESVFASEY